MLDYCSYCKQDVQYLDGQDVLDDPGYLYARDEHGACCHNTICVFRWNNDGLKPSEVA